MKITAIKAQQHASGRYSVFLDGVYSFSLSAEALLDTKLTLHQDLSEKEVTQIKARADEDKIYAAALRYAMLRPRSTWEIQIYLSRKKAPHALTEDIVNKLSKNMLVDDLTFARAWVRNRHDLKLSSRRKIMMELRAKHVTESVIEQALADESVDEQVLLKGLIIKKRRQKAYQDDTRLMGYLARQGFGYDAIRSALALPDDLDLG